MTAYTVYFQTRRSRRLTEHCMGLFCPGCGFQPGPASRDMRRQGPEAESLCSWWRRESRLLLKATYHPNWRATVDGVETDTVMLMPSFVGVRLLPGNHQVQLEYRSRRLRMVLLGLGLLTLPLIVISEKHGEGLWRRIAPRFVGPISNSAKGSVDE